MSDVIEKDVVVIGAGISGLVTAKSLKDDGFDVAILERTDEVGGLWTFRENDYGVMRFTHINVSKYNYCFSDYPFPDSVPDYPHHSDMAAYIKDYAQHFDLFTSVKFKVKVTNLEQIGEKWRVTYVETGDDGKTEVSNSRQHVVCSYVAVTTGHHARPSWPKFRGEETFTGEILHSVDFKDAITNNCVGKRVLIVGIGNSAVDAAVDCATVGRCKRVYVSTRSGAWIVPNYLFGFATDLYACRFFFTLPAWLRASIFGTLIKLITGSPWRWGLNPKMDALASQPTVSPTLIHHIQRNNIKIVPNITHMEGKTVHFINGVSEEFDQIVYCTGYSVDLPFLSDSLRKDVLGDGNRIKLFKNVFAPEIGHSLAFIGFIQPASGGILSMSEIQGRWFSELCKGSVKLPSRAEMEMTIKKEKEDDSKRWYKSERHTIQKDPIVYIDDIASFIGAKPDLLAHPSLAWRFLFSSCGAAQWRLNGPHCSDKAMAQVKKVPMTDFMNYSGYLIAALLLYLAYLGLKVVFSLF